MVKESWGKKRTCPKCDTRFYDLNKDPLICPNCEHTFSLESIMEVFKKSPKETSSKKTSAQTTPTDIEAEDIILDAILNVLSIYVRISFISSSLITSLSSLSNLINNI